MFPGIPGGLHWLSSQGRQGEVAEIACQSQARVIPSGGREDNYLSVLPARPILLLLINNAMGLNTKLKYRPAALTSNLLASVLTVRSREAGETIDILIRAR